MTPQDFCRAMEESVGTAVSRETLGRLERYAALLAKWTRAINLIGPATLPDLWRRHFLDSAQLLRYLPPTPEGRPRVIADLGSGAGFPGLVLAILGAGEIHLVESDRRKAQFLREVSRETAAGARVHEGRIEELSPLCADCITARALAPLDRLVDYALPHLAPAGVLLFLKGAEAAAELTAARARWSMPERRIAGGGLESEAWTSISDPRGQVLRLSRPAPGTPGRSG